MTTFKKWAFSSVDPQGETSEALVVAAVETPGSMETRMVSAWVAAHYHQTQTNRRFP